VKETCEEKVRLGGWKDYGPGTGWAEIRRDIDKSRSNALRRSDGGLEQVTRIFLLGRPSRMGALRQTEYYQKKKEKQEGGDNET